jgi:hypothetical protein
MVDGFEQAAGAATQDQPSEQEMRAAYEAELSRVTSSEMILQTTVSLLNIGGRRLGLAPPQAASSGDSAGPSGGSERDLEQVRDAIDAASALLPILERRMPRELAPLRDAIAQLQVAYARESQSAGKTASAAPQDRAVKQEEPTERQKPTGGEQQQGPGPAQASGRLWVPGR